MDGVKPETLCPHCGYSTLHTIGCSRYGLPSSADMPYVGLRFTVNQAYLGLSAGNVVTLGGLIAGDPIKGFTCRKVNRKDGYGGYWCIPDHLNDRLPNGTTFKLMSSENVATVQIEVLPSPTVMPRICLSSDCTLKACIDSYYCLDHQKFDAGNPYPAKPEGYKVTDNGSAATYSDKCPSTPTTQESSMNGAIYTVAVVRTKTVAQGEGVTAGVQKSEVVHLKSNFAALNDDAAKGIAMAEAINDYDLDVNDPTQPVEVRLTKF